MYRIHDGTFELYPISPCQSMVSTHVNMLPCGRSLDSFSTGCKSTFFFVQSMSNAGILCGTNKKKGGTDLGSRDAEKTGRHADTLDGHLIVAKLDTIQILNAKTVSRDQTIRREDFVHLSRCNECTSPLSDDRRDC